MHVEWKLYYAMDLVWKLSHLRVKFCAIVYVARTIDCLDTKRTIISSRTLWFRVLAVISRLAENSRWIWTRKFVMNHSYRPKMLDAMFRSLSHQNMQLWVGAIFWGTLAKSSWETPLKCTWWSEITIHMQPSFLPVFVIIPPQYCSLLSEILSVYKGPTKCLIWWITVLLKKNSLDFYTMSCFSDAQQNTCNTVHIWRLRQPYALMITNACFLRASRSPKE